MTPEKRFPYIDGLKGLAILGVLANHWLRQFLVASVQDFASPTFFRLLLGGQFGVSLFFLVSAFTLHRSLLSRQTEKNLISKFYLRRFWRIVPLYLIAISLLLWKVSPHRRPDYWCCIFLLCSFRNHAHLFNENWSLIAEESFYLLLPLLFLFKLNPKKLVFLLMGTLILRHTYLATSTDVFRGVFPLVHWYVFVLGILLSHLLPTLSNLLTRISAWKLRLVEGIFLVTALIFAGRAEYGHGDLGQALLMLGLFILASSPRTLSGKICRLALMRRFGIACYSIYLFHKFLILAALTPLQDLRALHGIVPTDYIFLASFPVFALVTLALGTVVYYALERPISQIPKSYSSYNSSIHRLARPIP